MDVLTGVRVSGSTLCHRIDRFFPNNGDYVECCTSVVEWHVREGLGWPTGGCRTRIDDMGATPRGEFDPASSLCARYESCGSLSRNA
jgi:hypothetical protein